MHFIRSFLLPATAAACLSAAAFAAHAADWPAQKPITLVVPFAAGGNTDATARLLAERLAAVVGQQVIVQNRTGAGSNVGSASVARSAPDGYTVLFATSTIATNVSLYKDMGFDLRKDLVPVTQFSLVPNVLTINNDLPATTLQAFIDHAKKNGASMSYGSAGNGSASHLSGALFNSLAQVDMVHVPYRGGAPANVDLIGGQVQAVFSPLGEVLAYIESGKLRALGVTTKDRSPRLPGLPAIGEALPGFEVALWNGVFVPAGTPDAIVGRLASGVQEVLRDPALRKVLADQGAVPVGNPPAEFSRILEEEIGKWGKLVALSGARVD